MEEITRPCEVCGQMIDPERVEALPDTRLCGLHAREIARYGGEFRLTVKQDKLNKPGSLKKNPGDVVVTGKTRNDKAIAMLKADWQRGQR
jgi:hypothetical protein